MHQWKKIVPAMVALAVSVGMFTTHSVFAQNGMTAGNEQISNVSGPAAGEGGETPPEGTPPEGTPPAGGPGKNGTGGTPPAPGASGENTGVSTYDAVRTIEEDTALSGQTINSEGKDENAVNISGGALVTMKNMIISRTSSNSTGGDNSSFYGVGAAILNRSGKTIIEDSTITTDAAGGAGVFSYGEGVTYVSDTQITTKKDTSGGIHAAGGGTLYAWDVTAETQGESSAAIRSDRGGGKIVADGGSYTSHGTGSPAIYSTADIVVNQANLFAANSEAICIEGRNSVRLFDCDLGGNMQDNSQNDCTWNVILYQSMSGDSEIGNSIFEMNGGKLSAGRGGMFYTTNTQSTFVLKNVNITNAEDAGFFLRCTGNANKRGWGTTGANGADCTFTGISQTMEGDVIWDSISTLKMYLTSGSTLKGAVCQDESCAGNGGSGSSELYISDDSQWVVTGDSTLSKLSCAGKIMDESGKTVTVKGLDGTVYVEGESDYVITVGSYVETADLKGASTGTTWESYEVEREYVSDNAVNGTGDDGDKDESLNGSSGDTDDNTDKKASVSVKSTKILSVKRKKKTMTLKLKKVKGASGYRIRYSTKKNAGGKNTVTLKVGGTKKVIRGLSAKKIYYVKAQAYVKNGSKTVYGSWTKVKKVKKAKK